MNKRAQQSLLVGSPLQSQTRRKSTLKVLARQKSTSPSVTKSGRQSRQSAHTPKFTSILVATKSAGLSVTQAKQPTTSDPGLSLPTKEPTRGSKIGKLPVKDSSKTSKKSIFGQKGKVSSRQQSKASTDCNIDATLPPLSLPTKECDLEHHSPDNLTKYDVDNSDEEPSIKKPKCSDGKALKKIENMITVANLIKENERNMLKRRKKLKIFFITAIISVVICAIVVALLLVLKNHHESDIESKDKWNNLQ